MIKAWSNTVVEEYNNVGKGEQSEDIHNSDSDEAVYYVEEVARIRRQHLTDGGL